MPVSDGGQWEKGDIATARKMKEEVMEKIYHLFLNCFGVPPTKFDFEYENEKGYFVDKDLTPKTFFEKYIGERIDEYQSLINSPTSDKPYMKNYTIEYLGNVKEGKAINHLNLPMERIKELIIKQLSDGEPVWFGSDVSFYRDPKLFAWDDKSFDYESEFDLSVEFSKENGMTNPSITNPNLILASNLAKSRCSITGIAP